MGKGRMGTGDKEWQRTPTLEGSKEKENLT
jgi:hypothetical protein